MSSSRCGQVGVVLADDGRDILDHEARLRLQKARRDCLERRRDGSHPRWKRRRRSGHVGIEVILVLGVDVGAGKGGLRGLPAVERIELCGIFARRGGEDGVCVVDELGVG